MLPDLQRLIDLQHIEHAIAEARRQIAAHPERLAAVDAQLDAVRQRVESARQQLKESQDARRALEKDAAVYQGRLGKFKDQLSAVKTNREYQAMQKEIEVAQHELLEVEDRVLEQMVQGDTMSAEVKTAESELAAAQKTAERAKADLTTELANLETALQRSLDSRAVLIPEIDTRALALFEQVMKVRKGVAVATAIDGLCAVCHVRLRPHVFQQVRHNETIIQCDSCQRILYYVPPPAPVEPPVTHAP